MGLLIQVSSYFMGLHDTQETFLPLPGYPMGHIFKQAPGGHNPWEDCCLQMSDVLPGFLLVLISDFWR